MPIPGMALCPGRLSVFLSHNSQQASSFFHSPAEQVVTIGVVVDNVTGAGLRHILPASPITVRPLCCSPSALSM